MAAPTKLQREESPCQQGAVHTWHPTTYAVIHYMSVVKG
jgi:hypothetical protein